MRDDTLGMRAFDLEFGHTKQNNPCCNRSSLGRGTLVNGLRDLGNDLMMYITGSQDGKAQYISVTKAIRVQQAL